MNLQHSERFGALYRFIRAFGIGQKAVTEKTMETGRVIWTLPAATGRPQ